MSFSQNSEWKSINLSNIAPDEISQATNAVGSTMDIISQSASGLSSALNVLSSLIIDVNDPLKAVIDNAVQRIELLMDAAFNVLKTGIYFYYDGGAVLSGGRPDGFSGFLSRLDSSLRDPGDNNKPEFQSLSQVESIILLAGAQDIANLHPFLKIYGELFGIQKFKYASNRLLTASKNLPDEIIESMSSPPDWYSTKVQDILPPALEIEEKIKQALGMIKTAPALSDFLSGLVYALQDKAEILQETANELKSFSDRLTALVSTPGLYGLHIQSNNEIQDFIREIQNADNPPSWNHDSYVIGVVLLGGTSDFSAIPSLFGL